MNTYLIPNEWIGKEIKVALVGCGGTGSEMMDEVYRIETLLVKLGGMGLSVTAYDPDLVSEANIGRQRFWPCDVGFNKAEVLINRINAYGGVNWRYEDKSFSTDDLPSFDLIITCVDTPKLRADIGKWQDDANSYNATTRLWLDCGNDTHQGNVVLGHISHEDSDGDSLPNVFDLYPSLSTMPDDQHESCSTEEAIAKQDYGINRSVAREAANLLWALLRHGKLNHHCSFIDIRTGTVNPLPIDPAQWALFGWSPAQQAPH
jgi:PRTRC genetic system ThiF family protein